MSNYIEVIKSTSVKAAQKEYDCMSSPFVSNCIYDFDGLSFAEKRAFILARASGFKIKVGDPYIHQFNRAEGIVYTFRAIPAMHAICIAHDLYAI